MDGYHSTDTLVWSVFGDVTLTETLLEQRRLFYAHLFSTILSLVNHFLGSRLAELLCNHLCHWLRLIKLILLQRCQLAQHCSTYTYWS